MKNKEKYEKEIMNIACSGDSIAVLKESGRIVSCNETKCCLCLFRGSDCKEKIREWAESESIEKTVISKKDRSFLDCLREEYKYIARDENDILCAYRSEPFKKGAYWYCGRGSYFRLNPHFDVDFQMIKWEDDKPWLIENLKKLEVVEGYQSEEKTDEAYGDRNIKVEINGRNYIINDLKFTANGKRIYSLFKIASGNSR